MNVLIGVFSVIVAVLVSHLAKSTSKIASSTGYFIVFCITYICVYFPLNTAWTWWANLKNPDLNALVDNLNDVGDILTDTELLYKPLNKNSVPGAGSQYMDSDTCQFIAD